MSREKIRREKGRTKEGMGGTKWGQEHRKGKNALNLITAIKIK